MIKCIASDMDGTLLSANQTISPENKQAILHAQSKGVEVVVATGRSYEEASLAVKMAGIECSIICLNGAEVRSATGEIVSANPLASSLAKDIAKQLDEHGLYFEVYTNKGTYSNDEEKGIAMIVDILKSANPNTDIDQAIAISKSRFQFGFVQKIENYEPLFSDPDIMIYKLLTFSDHHEKLEACRKALEPLNHVTVTSSAKGNLEISSDQAQKGIALQAFVEHLGIRLEDTMAIGDNYNDISMLKRVGRSVAMGNAEDEIKKLCDIVTDSNENNGVAKAILEVLK